MPLRDSSISQHKGNREMLSTSAIKNANDVNWKRISIWKKRRGGFATLIIKWYVVGITNCPAGSDVLTLYSLCY